MLTRFPRRGEVKTRIAAELGDDFALELHDRLTRHTLRQLLALQACREARAEVRHDASFVHAGREWLGKGPVYRYQGEGDLGARLQFAFASAFSKRAARVVVVGSDCARLTAGHLRKALSALEEHDVVLGPAEDGGYYLLGIRRGARGPALSSLFDDVPWGTSDVFAQTLHVAENSGLTVAVLETLPDVDLPTDVKAGEAAMSASASLGAGCIDVVIPALDEAELVGKAVESALRGGAARVIVADSSASEATSAAAAAAGALTLRGGRGRARQMNAGAAVATGDILCFLHADTRLPEDFATRVREVLAQPDAVAAAFDFSVDATGWRAALIGTLGTLRWRLTRLPYGDQALCVPRHLFDALGGFPDIPTMEDYEFAVRLRRFGKIRRVAMPTITSNRSWEEHGLLWPTTVNLLVIAGYRLGAPASQLARLRQAIAPTKEQV